MANRRLIQSTNAFTLALIVLGILTVVNFLSARRFVRLDMTEGKIYTLSSSSKRVVSSLEDILSVEVYFSEKLPPHLMTLRNEISDLLDEYRAFSKGNIRITFTDPLENPDVEGKVRRLGIPIVQMNIIEKDQAQLINGYLGLGLFYSDKSEAIPVIQTTANLEYELTTKIIKITSSETKTVGFLGDWNGLQIIRGELEKQYDVIQVETERSIPDNVQTLILNDPKGLTPQDRFEIDQFIMKGGKTIFLANGVEIGQGLNASGSAREVDDLLEKYGVKVHRDLVLDRSNETAGFSQGFMTFFVPYPFWVKVRKENFHTENPIVSPLESMVLPWTSSLELLADKGEGIEATVLATSTERSWTQTGVFILNPQQSFAPNQETMKKHNLALLLSGTFRSAYSDTSPPEGAGAEPVMNSLETRMVVVGTSRFVEDSQLQRFPENGVFFLNTVDWLTLGEDLISIRSRGATDRPLKSLSEKERTTVKMLNTYGIGILIALFGLGRFYIRHRKKITV
jgi:gliding-associated putative ABC transporter substrate-binding component GldG